MTQALTTDTVERVIDASPQLLYGIVSDVTRTPELSPEIKRCTWVRGTKGPAVGARFRAVNTLGRGRSWPNWPVVTTADPGREFAVSRTEPLAGTLEWRYRFVPEGTQTRVRVLHGYPAAHAPLLLASGARHGGSRTGQATCAAA